MYEWRYMLEYVYEMSQSMDAEPRTKTINLITLGQIILPYAQLNFHTQLRS